MPSPPSVSQLLGINPFPAEASPITPPGDSREPMNPSPPHPPLPASEIELLARLDQKRREIEAEIEAFKAAKEEEYRELERWLRAEQKQLQNTNGGDATTHVAAAAATTTTAASSSNDKGFTRGEEQVGRTSGTVGTGTGSQIPLDLGGSKLNDTLKLELPDNRKQPGLDESSADSSATTSPPFEKELQAAGLFTPRYLPLLDNNFFRQSPPQESPASLPQPVMPKLTTIPGPPSRTGNTSPAYPLASSLKSSSGSSTGTLNKLKQKSPKRVTFLFEDENSVPSRSSPPPSTKVHWTLEEDYPFEDEDGFVEYEGEDVEEVDQEEFEETAGKVEQVENITEYVGERSTGDELVVPMTLDNSAPIVQGGDAFSGLGIRGVSGGLDTTNGNNSTTPGFDSEDDEVNGTGADDDDDEEALFDLDETIPEVVDNSPPQRDYSALLDTALPQTNDRLTASKFPMLPSFTPTFPSVPASASDPILTFGKSPGPRLGLPRGGSGGARRGSLSSSLSLSPLLSQKKEEETISPSLPTFGWKGGMSTEPSKSGFVPTPGGRFRRRSIVKYDLPEDDVNSLKGKGKDSSRTAIDEEEEDEDETLLLSRSPNATSLPMSISRHSPAAFVAKSSSSTRSPKLPVIQKDPQNSLPIAGSRSSPKPGRSPLSGASQVHSTPMRKVDSADLLAAMPTSFSAPAEEGSPEKSDSVASYRRSSPFPSAYDRTPYRTAYAAEVAAAAALEDDEDYGGAMKSVVGGVDGRTGLDPDVSSFSYRPGVGVRARRGSESGGVMGMEAMDPGQMSFGMRMAFENVHKERSGR
ncbi:uncharacterized protein H6S33_007690 [Morchella sextelata]|uniref:uncharacterized protein n=1 Tax=Morchella sextelata TaxID=1174677 RepID=UPI001D05A5A9|nr:uncharacterized protein H6S33_007690 [Morchella sextelata]KAH0603368.1 hypothetical protein H6S33_007690 [Morchella sextelata]